MQKKRASLAFVICSVLLLNIAAVLATEPGYTRLEHATVVEPTIDGKWTSSSEWTDTGPTEIGDTVVFRGKYSMLSMDPITVTSNFIIEFLTDTTDDAGDYWQLCIDGTLNGGSAPQTDDFMIEVIGHGTPTVYQGTGSGWTEVTPDSGDLAFADSITDSPTSSTPHWVAEFTILKTSGVILMDQVWGLRLAAYDESDSAAGVQAWPPTDPDVPSGWGEENYTSEVYVPDEPEPSESEPETSEPEPSESEPETSEPEPSESEPETVAPDASFTYSPLAPLVNDTITFDASASSDSDGSIVSYSWDFGDGATSSSMNPTHSYDQEGSYTVTLTVTDNDGLTDTATKTISDVEIPEFSSIAVLFVALTALVALGIHYKKKMAK